MRWLGFSALIVADHVASYLNAVAGPRSDVMADMEALAERDDIPIVLWETGRLLAVLVAALQAQRIIEVGTAIGYSTLHMAQALGPGGVIVTLERDEQRIAQAREFWTRAGVADRIELVEGDALQTLPNLEGSFDMAFVDATKQEYGDYLGMIESKLNPGALVAIDNVLMSGEVGLSDDDDTFWSKANLQAARALNQRLMDADGWLTSIIPIGDGVTLTTRADPPDHDHRPHLHRGRRRAGDRRRLPAGQRSPRGAQRGHRRREPAHVLLPRAGAGARARAPQRPRSGPAHPGPPGARALRGRGALRAAGRAHPGPRHRGGGPAAGAA